MTSPVPNMPRAVTSSGIKALQTTDLDDRCMAYRNMRRMFRKDTPYTTDVDQIEWVVVAGVWHACAVIELTQRRRGTHSAIPPESYFERIVQRFEVEGSQAAMARAVAAALGCRAFLVVFNDDASLLWVYNLSSFGGEGWHMMTRANYEAFLLWLKQQTLFTLEAA